jgi:exopolyphosphatase / guanosine-5'-triphosphate,3'-diphosphate pyrophosphatase
MLSAPKTIRVAGLDLGTNTCLCLIADIELSEDRSSVLSMKVVRDDVRVVRLGQGVNATRALHPEALLRAEDTFREFERLINSAKCDRVLAVATSAARDVTNGQALLDLGAKYGIPIEIISGEKEAELTFAGAIEPSWSGLTAVIDVGGGSTELILGDKDGIRARVSADVGSVRMTEAYVTQHPIPQAELDAISKRVREALKAAKEKISNTITGRTPIFGVGQIGEIAKVIGVAGTPTTLAAVDLGHVFETEKVHGHEFTRARLEEWTAKLATMTVEERAKLAGMEPKRADVIVAGAICVTEAMRVLERESLQVSVRGLRYGVANWCATRSEARPGAGEI